MDYHSTYFDKNMVQAIIMDVDGVIVGEKIGVNSPDPHPDVIKALKSTRENEIPIVLCTAKPYFGILPIIRKAHLDNPHITEGGSVIIDPIDRVIIKKHTIDNALAAEVIEAYLASNVYTEFYTVDNYLIEERQSGEITKKHTHILQREPQKVSSLAQAAIKSEIVKIMPIANDEHDKERVSGIFQAFNDRLTLNWGLHPVALPLQFGIITAKGISKRQAAHDISKNLSVSFDNILGIGDGESDWQFIELCRYAAAMGNASEKLKQLVLSKAAPYSFIAPAVDENGVLEILEYFTIDN